MGRAHQQTKRIKRRLTLHLQQGMNLHFVADLMVHLCCMKGTAYAQIKRGFCNTPHAEHSADKRPLHTGVTAPLFNPETSILLQKHHPCTGNRNSEMLGDSKHAFLDQGDVLATVMSCKVVKPHH